MALPSSPPISLNQIKSEFGASGTRALTEFYRGGAFVPNIPQNSGVPTSGTISTLDFLGATNQAPLEGSISAIVAEEVRGPDPMPPGSLQVVGTSNATVSGGTGTYTYSWEVLTGPAQPLSGTTNSFFSIRAEVPANSNAAGTIRCTISDGQQTIVRTASYMLIYTTLA